MRPSGNPAVLEKRRSLSKRAWQPLACWAILTRGVADAFILQARS